MEKLFGGIEAGGAKFVCSVGNSALEIIERVNYTAIQVDDSFFAPFDQKRNWCFMNKCGRLWGYSDVHYIQFGF
ncbi:hypothetical protein IGI80_001427 [Enterococcus sp. DIV1420a]|uniref:hypothetical protein n=1 Tax=Enterococcus faecalis TaxID=1351 RepID=UPI003F24AE17